MQYTIKQNFLCIKLMTWIERDFVNKLGYCHPSLQKQKKKNNALEDIINM